MRRSLHVAILGLMFAVSVGSAAAQEVPRGEVSGGWKLLHATDVVEGVDQTLSKGWYADVAANVTRSFAIVGEVAGAYKSYEESATFLGARVDVNADVSIHTFLGGLRFTRRSPRVVPFAQVLFGLARATIDLEGSAALGGQTISIDESESSSEFGFDVGGGVNINVSDRIGVRVNASYLRVGASNGGNAFRLGAGVVLPF